MARRKAKDLIERLAAAEDAFCGRQFIAPAVPGGIVGVRIGEATCQLKIAPDNFHGFGIFEPISFTEAALVREASLGERKSYLSLFPSISLIATRQWGPSWLCAAASRGDRRFCLDGLIPIQLSENVDLFDLIEGRFDGNVFWFERTSSRANPRHADRLRKALLDQKPPAQVKMSGMTAEHRAAYDFNYRLAVEPKRKIETESDAEAQDGFNSDLSRVREALSHSGAQFTGMREAHGNLQVSFTVGGRSFTSAVDKENFGLVSAGVCLDGYDNDFDLTSLVGVLREGIDTHQV